MLTVISQGWKYIQHISLFFDLNYFVNNFEGFDGLAMVNNQTCSNQKLMNVAFELADEMLGFISVLR